MEAAGLGCGRNRFPLVVHRTTDDAFIGHRPVYEELADEIAEMVGAVAFKAFVREVSQRPPGQLLPHPALKKRL